MSTANGVANPQTLFDQSPFPARDTTEMGEGMAFATLYSIARTETFIPAYWSRHRDVKLATFSRLSDHLKIAINTFISKASTVPLRISPRDRSVQSHVDLAESMYNALMVNSGFMNGFYTEYQKFLYDYLCLYGRSRVHLGGDRKGKTISIQELVRTKDPGPVLSVDPTGKIVERRVIDWQETPLGDRRWWWISLKDASSHSGSKRGGLWMTEDHPVLTDQGWKLARDVEVGMKVATGDPVPSLEQASALVGMLLGDASLQMVRKRAILRMTQGEAQEDWLQFKQSIFEGFQWTGYNKNNGGGFGSGSYQVGVNSRATLSLVSWYRDWYPQGKKVVPKQYVEKYFSPRLLATWFCDDGSIHFPKNRKGERTRPNATLYTNGFTKEDVEWLADFLTARGYTCKVGIQTNKKSGSQYPVLHFGADGAERLFSAIAPYVPPNLRYKLPEGSRPFDSDKWRIPSASVYYDEVVFSEARVLRSGPTGEVKTTYHIGVEDTRNFVAGNLVVHNTQDNGAFALVLGPGLATGPIVGRASGIVHLASYRCTRTKDPLYPVVYLHTDGKRYKIFYTRIISMVNLPAPDPDLNGIGQCPVGLCVDAAKELYDITLFVQEKLGSRPQRQILYAKTGATIDQLIGAVSHAENQLTNQGLSRFAKTLFLAPKLAGGKLELDQIDLASVPDGFNRQSDTLISLAIIAAAFGLDLRDLAFSFGVQGQTRSDADIQHLKGMGKGVAEVTAEFAKQLCDRFLPPSLVASFDYMDDSQDLKTATVSAQRSTARTRDIMGEVLNPRVARQHMLRTGELTESEFEELELSDGRMVDGTNVLALFYSPDPVYKEVLDLSISEPLDVAANEPEMVLKAIGKQERVAWEMLADTGGERNRRKIRYALAALENLKKLYEEKQEADLMQEQQEAQLEAANKPNALPQAKSGRVGSDKAAVTPNAGRSKKNALR